MSAYRWDFPWRKLSSALELTLLEEGGTDWRVGRFSATRRPGSVAVVAPARLAVGTAVHAPGTFFSVEIDPAHVDVSALGTTQLDTPAVTAAMARLAGHVRRQHDDLAVESALATLLDEVRAARHPSPPRPAHDASAAARIRALLHERYAEPLSLAAIARAVRVSRSHAVRVFRSAYGVPPFEYVMHLRLERAAAALRAGARPSEVAAATGFADQSHLNRWFTRMYQITPARFRNALGAPGDSNRPRRSHRTNATGRDAVTARG